MTPSQTSAPVGHTDAAPNESGRKVDVLAVMDRGIADLMDGHPTMWTARDVRAMRAAVAELVEAVRCVYGDAPPECTAPCPSCDIRAALAKFPEPRP